MADGSSRVLLPGKEGPHLGHPTLAPPSGQLRTLRRTAKPRGDSWRLFIHNYTILSLLPRCPLFWEWKPWDSQMSERETGSTARLHGALYQVELSPPVHVDKGTEVVTEFFWMACEHSRNSLPKTAQLYSRVRGDVKNGDSGWGTFLS